MKTVIRKNEERNGIEILFSVKPEQETLAWLKDRGFRWSRRQGLWWVRYNESLMKAVHERLDSSTTAPATIPKGNNVQHNTPSGGLEVGHAIDLYGKDIKDRWTVYHIPTGKTVSLRFAAEKAAIKLKHELLKLANWTLEPSELKAQYPELEAEVIKINREVFAEEESANGDDIPVVEVPVEPLPVPDVVSVPVQDLPELQPQENNDKVISITTKMSLMDRARRVLAAYGEDE